MSRRRTAISVFLTLAAVLMLSADQPSGVGARSPAAATPVAQIVAGPLTYARHRQLDVYGVPNRQRVLPVIVMVHACCGDRADLGKLSEAIAAKGAIVMNADWAGIKNNSRFPDAYADVACAVRFAKARAADFGGDPADVTLLGWSDGAMASAVVAAAGERFDRSSVSSIRSHLRYRTPSLESPGSTDGPSRSRLSMSATGHGLSRRDAT